MHYRDFSRLEKKYDHKRSDYSLMILTIEKLRNFLSHIIPAWVSNWVLYRRLALLVFRSIGTVLYNDTKMIETDKHFPSQPLRLFPSETLLVTSVFVC